MSARLGRIKIPPPPPRPALEGPWEHSRKGKGGRAGREGGKGWRAVVQLYTPSKVRSECVTQTGRKGEDDFQLIRRDKVVPNSINVKMLRAKRIPLVLLLLVSVRLSDQHARLLEPPSRASLWRLGYPTP